MTPERWQQINALFDAVQRQPTGERFSFLNHACNGDGALRAAVAGLLDQDASAERDGFLATPCPLRRQLRPEALALDLDGHRVGPYELRERVGAGGMGCVYRAVRVADYRQEVALKLMKRGLDSEELLQRFRTERQLLAGLRHPHIAQLLDGGTTDDGIPYLVLEYIDGRPIDVYCDGQQLDVRARARLLHTVCQAVHHAHERHVLHRDLKPANILVTADGTPKLTDFGIAKNLEDDSGQTQTGMLLGTPSYMAPEQAAGKAGALGPATDVYALGAVLYELLTGRPPFKGATPRETLEQVCTQEPVPPARVQPGVPRDLETLVLRCLQKEPAKRYATAQELADELQRFLAGEPIRARPVGRGERFVRWCRRNPRVAGLLAALLLVFFAGFAGMTVLWLAARAEQQEADRQRQRAEANEQLAWRAVDDITRAAEVGLANEPHMSATQLELLEKALAYRQQFIRDHRSDANVRFKTAQAYHFVGRLQTRLGRPAQGVRALREQIALLQELAAEFPEEPKYRFDLFHSHKALADALAQLDEDGPAEEASYRALALVRDLVRDYPAQPLYRDALANQLGCVGSLRGAHDDHEGAIRLHQEALQVAEALVREFPVRREPPPFACNVAQSLHALASFAIEAGDFGAAEAQYRRALAVMEQVARDYPGEPAYPRDVAGKCLGLANVLAHTGRPSEAEALYRRAVSLGEKLARDYPAPVGNRAYLADARHCLGDFCLRTGHTAEAAEILRRALDEYARLAADFPELAFYKAWYGWLLAHHALPALRDARRAVPLLEQAVAQAPREADYRIILGTACYRTGDYAACVRLLQREEQAASFAAYGAGFYLAMARWRLGDHDGARRDFDRAAAALARRPLPGQDQHRFRAEAAALLGL